MTVRCSSIEARGSKLIQNDARDATGARGTVGNASRGGFPADCGKSLPKYPRSVPLSACSRESHLSGNSQRNLPRTSSQKKWSSVNDFPAGCVVRIAGALWCVVVSQVFICGI